MLSSIQPAFYTGGALRIDYPHYVMRQADHHALRAVQQGKLIYTIAPRQMGKTSLIKRVIATLESQGWHCCFVDLATLRNLERPRWFSLLGERIAQARKIDSISSPLQDQQDFRAFLLNDIGLNWAFTPIKLALFFDEVEGLLGLDFSDDFLMTLRDLYQQRDSYPGQFLIAFAGAADPQTLVKDETISPFNIAEEIVLRDFTPTESATLTAHLRLAGVPVDEAVHQHIYDWTEGHPYLTQRICEIIEGWVELGQARDISTAVVDKAVQLGLLSAHGRDKNIKHILSNLTNPLFSLPKIWQRLLANEPVYATEPGFYTLYLSGLVRERNDGQVQIRNNIYRAAMGIDHVRLGQSDGKRTRDEPPRSRVAQPVSPGSAPASESTRLPSSVLNSGKIWAVMIGINTYDDPYIADLSVCVDDVTAIRQLLLPGCAMAELLTDATPERLPTRARILGAVASVAQAAGDQDLLLFYFSGHGVAEGGESYLLPSDARLTALKHTALAMSDLCELIDQSPARVKTIILDACHSGAAMGKAAPSMPPEFLQRVFAEAEGIAVLASCKQGQRSWEWREQGRSVFTYYLLEALAGQSDFERKGFVTVSDVNRYVTDRIKGWAAAQGVAQTPTLQYTAAGEIVLNYY